MEHTCVYFFAPIAITWVSSSCSYKLFIYDWVNALCFCVLAKRSPELFRRHLDLSQSLNVEFFLATSQYCVHSYQKPAAKTPNWNSSNRNKVLRPTLSGGFWKPDFFSELLFSACVHVIYTRSGTESDSLFSEHLRPFG